MKIKLYVFSLGKEASDFVLNALSGINNVEHIEFRKADKKSVNLFKEKLDTLLDQEKNRVILVSYNREKMVLKFLNSIKEKSYHRAIFFYLRSSEIEGLMKYMNSIKAEEIIKKVFSSIVGINYHFFIHLFAKPKNAKSVEEFLSGLAGIDKVVRNIFISLINEIIN